jgi:hypothetical protein
MDLRRALIVILCAVVGYLGWRQLADDETVRLAAEQAACDGRTCDIELEKAERTLFGRKWSFRTYRAVNRRVEVSCVRVLWIIGDYHCSVTTQNTMGEDRF